MEGVHLLPKAELLNESLFFGLDQARQAIAVWANDYNTERPHSSLGYTTPRSMPPISPQQTIGCATPTSSADRLLLPLRREAYCPPRL
jgi:putative transposase